MRDSISIPRLSVILITFGLAACAGSGAAPSMGGDTGGEGITIEVRNDVVPPTSVIVWVVPESGNRTRLGPVPPNARRSFNYTPPLQAMQIVLMAETEGPSTGTMSQQRERRSNPFGTLDVQAVSWTLSRPNVQIGG